MTSVCETVVGIAARRPSVTLLHLLGHYFKFQLLLENAAFVLTLTSSS